MNNGIVLEPKITKTRYNTIRYDIMQYDMIQFIAPWGNLSRTANISLACRRFSKYNGEKHNPHM